MNHLVNIDRLLIAYDDDDIMQLLRNVAYSLGFSVRTTDNYVDFCKIQQDFDPTAVMLDLQLPGRGGIEYLKALVEKESTAKVIFANGMDPRAASTASGLAYVLGLDVSATLQKPVDVHQLRRALRRVMFDSQGVTVSGLEAAIRDGKIKPHYQPKVTRDADKNWIISEVEALARWYQPDGTVVKPDHFISLAEENGLIKPLTDSLLNQVAKQLGAWNKQGLLLRAAVNLSPLLLEDVRFPDEVEKLLKKHEVDNQQLIFEMTENIVVENTTSTSCILARLRDRNFGLSITDFGVSGAPLAQLSRMPFDEIKIDRMLTQQASSGKGGWIAIEAMVLLGQKLGMSVCAEGIEKQDSFDYLATIGCDKQQGFLIGRPLTPTELTTRLREGNRMTKRAMALL